LKREDWLRDASMATAAGRRAHEDAIEAAIEEWTNTRDPDTAMRELQAVGIAAGAARLPVELLKDAQLHSRGFIQEVDRAFIGKHPQPSLPFREGETPFPIRFAPPTLGEYNAEILGGMLGLSPAELQRLASEDIIGTEMLMEEQLLKRGKQAAE
jgi:crotonobetainyl-CoA:carnitine CoA-transferase CaiB-like acyl-CoA transferase